MLNLLAFHLRARLARSGPWMGCGVASGALVAVVLAACGGSSNPKAVMQRPAELTCDGSAMATAEAAGAHDDQPSPTATASAPLRSPYNGPAILFDLNAGTAAQLELDNFGGADWIDDCSAVVAFDPVAKVQAVIDLRGQIVYTVNDAVKKDRTPDIGDFVIPYVVHDGRHIAAQRFVGDPPRPTFVLTDVFTGESTTIQGATFYPEFSAGGQWVPGIRFDPAVGLTTETPRDSVEGAILARDCGDAAPYSCAVWHPEILQASQGTEIRRLARWSADGEYVFFRRLETCNLSSGNSSCDSERPLVVEVYSAASHAIVLTEPLPSTYSTVQWVGHSLAFNGGASNATSDSWRFVALDGTSTELPTAFNGRTWFSPDGKLAIHRSFTDRDGVGCALLDVTTGREIVRHVQPPSKPTTPQTCGHVSWTHDGRYALATGGNDDRDD